MRTARLVGLLMFAQESMYYLTGYDTFAFLACKDNPTVLQPGMVFFLHMIIFDDETGLAATPGRTNSMTEGGSEVLSNADLEFIVK